MVYLIIVLSSSSEGPHPGVPHLHPIMIASRFGVPLWHAFTSHNGSRSRLLGIAQVRSCSSSIRITSADEIHSTVHGVCSVSGTAIELTCHSCWDADRTQCIHQEYAEAGAGCMASLYYLVHDTCSSYRHLDIPSE
jgi:hypothetical protein